MLSLRLRAQPKDLADRPAHAPLESPLGPSRRSGQRGNLCLALLGLPLALPLVGELASEVGVHVIHPLPVVLRWTRELVSPQRGQVDW